MTRTAEQRLEAIDRLAVELLLALQPWAQQRPEVRSAATRLTVALAANPHAAQPREDLTPAGETGS